MAVTVSRKQIRESHQNTQYIRKCANRILRKNHRTISSKIQSDIESRVQHIQELEKKLRNEPNFIETIQKEIEDLTQLIDKEFPGQRKTQSREFVESVILAVFIALFLRSFVLEPFKIPSGSMIPTLAIGDHIFVNKFIYGLRIPFTTIRFFDFATPQRGDVIVFIFPQDPSKDFIKRVTAVAGDTVQVRHNTLYVNGKAVEKQHIGNYDYFDTYEVEEDQIFQMHAVQYHEYLDNHEYSVLYHPDRDQFRENLWPNMFRPKLWTENIGLTCDRESASAFCKVNEGYVFVMGDNRDNSADSREWGATPISNVKGKALFVWWSYGSKDGIRWERFFQGIH